MVTFVGQGDTDDATVTLGEDEIIEASIDVETESVYSLDYVEDLTDPIADGTEVTVTFGDEFPVILEYEGLDGNLSGTGYLAPRII
ncbi:hypothetical protein KZZ05_21135, partial [Marinobacter adhaerens]|uniref:hypothetical protein n=1 Tax=Marinobacter adhaerens TaxID=1033846 RepID=UPI001C5EC88E